MKMGLKESCISSFFIHVVTILTVLAVSQYHSKMLAGNLAVTLSEEDALPKGKSVLVKSPVSEEKHDQQKLASELQNIAAVAEVPAYGDADSGPDSFSNPASLDPPQNNWAPAASPTETESNRLSEGPDSGANDEFLKIHAVAFMRKTGLWLQSFVHAGVTDSNSETINGAYARLIVHYGGNGVAKTIDVATNSDGLKTILEQIRWSALPSTTAYLLKYDSLDLDIRIAIVNGYPLLYVAAL